jgi:hypothetical protein
LSSRTEGLSNEDQWVYQLGSCQWQRIPGYIKVGPGHYVVRKVRLLQCGNEIDFQIQDTPIRGVSQFRTWRVGQ